MTDKKAPDPRFIPGGSSWCTSSLFSSLPNNVALSATRDKKRKAREVHRIVVIMNKEEASLLVPTAAPDHLSSLNHNVQLMASPSSRSGPIPPTTCHGRTVGPKQTRQDDNPFDDRDKADHSFHHQHTTSTTTPAGAINSTAVLTLEPPSSTMMFLNDNTQQRPHEGQQQQPMPTLYHVKRTISSPIVQTLIELGLAHTTIRIQEVTMADLKSAEYRQHVNPMGTSPAFCDYRHPDDNHLQIWESGAILDYLLEVYDPHGRYWCTTSSGYGGSTQQQPHQQQQQQQQRAKYLQLKQYLIATVYPLVAAWFLRRQQESGKQQPPQVGSSSTSTSTGIQRPVVIGDHDDHDKDRTARETFRTVIGPYLTRCLGDGPYFMGDQFTVLDLIAAKPGTNLHQLGELAAFPALQAHFDRVSSRPSYFEAYYGRDATVRTAIPILSDPVDVVASPVSLAAVADAAATTERPSPVGQRSAGTSVAIATCETTLAKTTKMTKQSKKQRTTTATATPLWPTTTSIRRMGSSPAPGGHSQRATAAGMTTSTPSPPLPPPAIRS